MIVTLPAPLDEMLADVFRKTPIATPPVPHEMPLKVSEPKLVVTVDPFAKIP